MLHPEAAAPRRRDARRWIIAIVIGLTIVAIANAIFIYIAVSGADPVVPSYSTEHR